MNKKQRLIMVELVELEFQKLSKNVRFSHSTII